MFLRDARFKNEAPLLIFFEKGKTPTLKYVRAPEAKIDGWFIVQAPLQIAKLITNFKGFNLLPLISDGSNTNLSNIERTRTSFFEHQMNLKVFIYW